jgi:hypothetical protein
MTGSGVTARGIVAATLYWALGTLAQAVASAIQKRQRGQPEDLHALPQQCLVTTN